MSFSPGARIWIPCEVKPGPFPDERMVRVETPQGPWLGFVETVHLQDAPKEGRSQILATVTEVSGDEFVARLPGHPVGSSWFRGPSSRVQPVGSLEA